MKESSPRHTANEIAGLLDFHGTYYTVSQTLEWVNISVSVPKYKMADILPVIFEFLSAPEYRDENLSLYRNIRIKDLALQCWYSQYYFLWRFFLANSLGSNAICSPWRREATPSTCFLSGSGLQVFSS